MSGRRSRLIPERLGEVNAARLSSIVGGTRLNVPGNLANAGRLKRLLGDELAILVVLHFGDSRFYVPMAVRAKNVTVADVARLTARHWSTTRIARELKCSERTVYAKRELIRSRVQAKRSSGNREANP